MSDQEQSLAGEILADAQKRAERIRRRAEAEAEKVVQEARKEAAAERQRVLEDARRRADRRQAVVQARVAQQVRAMRRAVRQQALERARAAASEELARLAGGPEHLDVLTGLAVAAIEAMSGERFELVLRPEDRGRWAGELPERVAEAVRRKLGRQVQVEVAEEPLEASGGLLIRGAGGHEVADQTFEARLARFWPHLRGAVAELLGNDWENR